jgi:hypothetical protein
MPSGIKRCAFVFFFVTAKKENPLLAQVLYSALAVNKLLNNSQQELPKGWQRCTATDGGAAGQDGSEAAGKGRGEASQPVRNDDGARD